MPSRTDTVQGVTSAQVETDFMAVAADEKSDGMAVRLTGSSMLPLHTNGRTEAAAAVTAPAAAGPAMIVTAAAAADAPSDRNAARAVNDTRISARAHVSMRSCWAASTSGRRCNRRKKSCDANADISSVRARQSEDVLLVMDAHAEETRYAMSAEAAGGRTGTRSSKMEDARNISAAPPLLLLLMLSPRFQRTRSRAIAAAAAD